MVQATDLVCDVFANHPSAFDVFERHGMCEDCKQSPPPVPVSHFVEKHCNGQIDAFLSELNDHIASSN